jgi:hypothetical protein
MTLEFGGNNPEFESITTEDSPVVTEGEATDTLHLGSDQDRENAGNNGVAIGIGARAGGKRVTASGRGAAQFNTERDVTASGFKSCQNNSGFNIAASGKDAARDNTGNRVSAIGAGAAKTNTGENVSAIGRLAAEDNTGNGVIAIGRRAARNNSRDDLMIVSDQSGNTKMELDLATGDLKIDGTLTENASL